MKKLLIVAVVSFVCMNVRAQVLYDYEDADEYTYLENSSTYRFGGKSFTPHTISHKMRKCPRYRLEELNREFRMITDKTLYSMRNFTPYEVFMLLSNTGITLNGFTAWVPTEAGLHSGSPSRVRLEITISSADRIGDIRLYDKRTDSIAALIEAKAYRRCVSTDSVSFNKVLRTFLDGAYKVDTVKVKVPTDLPVAEELAKRFPNADEILLERADWDLYGADRDTTYYFGFDVVEGNEVYDNVSVEYFINTDRLAKFSYGQTMSRATYEMIERTTAEAFSDKEALEYERRATIEYLNSIRTSPEVWWGFTLYYIFSEWR